MRDISMRRTPLNAPDVVPAGIIVVGSALIAFHLIAVIFATLTAPSGPWPMMQGSDMVRPPQFAYSITSNYLMPYYLKYIKMPHHYHFATNRPGLPDTKLEIVLKDDRGNELPLGFELTDQSLARLRDAGVPAAVLAKLNTTKNRHFDTQDQFLAQLNTCLDPQELEEHRKLLLRHTNLAILRFPEEGTNGSVRHRQSLLAMGLAMDEMVTPPQSEVVPAPNQAPPKVTIWQPTKEPQTLHLETMDQHLIPRTGMVMRPSAMSTLLARSYARYLCRIHGAASAEIIRHHKEPIPAAVLFMDNVQANNFDEISSTFGDLPQ
jgi:hypothetical protein